MKQPNQVDKGTRQIVEETYRNLRTVDLDRASAFRLEKRLSTLILRAEEQILANKAGKHKELELEYRRRRAILKRIADGLAWRYLGFDDHLLQVYSMDPPTGFMAGKTGYKPERLTVEALSSLDKVRFAIQNDITNILRVGDITVLFDDDSVIPIEVKSSEKGATSERAKRQLERYNGYQTYLNTDILDGGGSTGKLRAIEIEYGQQDYYWKELEQIVFNTLNIGFAFQVLDSGVIILGQKPDSSSEEVRDLVEGAIKAAQWQNANVAIGFLSEQLKSQDSNILRYVIPITAFDITPNAGIPILLGDVVITVLIDQNEIVNRLNSVGLQAELTEDGRLKVLPSARSPIKKMEVLARPKNQLIYGLRRLPGFINYLVTVFSEAESKIETL